jgi:hypothetical protein
VSEDLVTVMVNGRPWKVLRNMVLGYDEIAFVAGLNGTPAISAKWKSGVAHEVPPLGGVQAEDGMEFYAVPAEGRP